LTGGAVQTPNMEKQNKIVSEFMKHKWKIGNVTIKQKKTLFKKGNDLRRINTQFKKGHKTPEVWKIKMRAKRALQIGEKCPAWKGGISFEPYGKEFNKKFKEQIRQRDGFRCQNCFRHQGELKDTLNVHHIDFNKKNNSPLNLISLCKSCHTQTNYGREDWTNYYNNLMNLMIGGELKCSH
jgi:hypothetical protein